MITNEINTYVKNIMNIFTNSIFTKTSKINISDYTTIKESLTHLNDSIIKNKITNLSLLEFTSIVENLVTQYKFAYEDQIVGNVFNIDFMTLYNSYAKLNTLANKIYNNKYNTRKL